MKRKLALLLSCIIIAAAASGCNSSKNNSDASGADAQNSAVSETAASDSGKDKASEVSDSKSNTPEASDSGDSSGTDEPSGTITIDESGVSIDEDGNIIIDIDDISDWSDVDGDDIDDTGDEPVDDEKSAVLNELSYQMIYLAPDGFSADDKLPAAFCITSADELNDFISANTAAYSLATEHTNDDYINKTSFVNETKDMDETYFKATDICVVVCSYKNGTECDIGDIYEKDGDIHIELCLEEPTVMDAASYVLFIIPAQKDTYKGKNLKTDISAIIFDNEDEELPLEA